LLLAQSAQGAGDMRPLLFMLLAIGAIFYFIVLRPQRNEQKKREEMLNAVAKGDHVVTIGGIHGTVEAIDVTKNVVSISVAPKTTIRVNRSALASVSSRKKPGADDDDKDKS
jgi:preprotein translocase subunit YajC